ncbi:hypothetical protein ACET3X_005514 [Alternaria dauci]|uniref:Uncharacterized protein n=1 Tax=Alternaria dauci TaxID=48095 RepID=A0ABR3UKX1_9PLEO
MSPSNTPNSPARSEGSPSYRFADLPKLPVDNNPGQHHDAGHHEHANDHESYNAVCDAFASVPAIPTNDFGDDGFGHGEFGLDEFTGKQNFDNLFADDLEEILDLGFSSMANGNDLSAPTFNNFTAPFDDFIAPLDNFTTPLNNGYQGPGNNEVERDDDPEVVTRRILSGALSPGQKAEAMRGLSESSMDKLYVDVMRKHGFRPIQSAAPSAAPVKHVAAMPSTLPSAMPSAMPTSTPYETPSFTPAAAPAPTAPADLDDDNNYEPIAWEETPEADANAPPPPPGPQPIYPAYTGKFQSGPDARAYRKRNRIAPKSLATDVDRVKRYGRTYWVRRIYEAMIDISNVSDSKNSIHRTRFMVEPAFDPLDLEAAAHHVFDEALAVHERGWVRPTIYHKKVVRGKLTDVSEKCLERRLARICLCLQQKKATVDDAVRGGVTLALLCDNPEARGFTKLSNNAGNAKRGERLRAAKEAEAEAEAEAEEAEAEESEEE